MDDIDYYIHYTNDCNQLRVTLFTSGEIIPVHSVYIFAQSVYDFLQFMTFPSLFAIITIDYS